MHMSQFEEFNKYYLLQSKGEENKMLIEEKKEETYEENEKNNLINDEKRTTSLKQLKLRESAFKRLNSLPKKYQTYKIDYKKQIVEEVIINIIIF